MRGKVDRRIIITGKNRLYNLTNLAVQPAADKLIENPFRWKRVCKRDWCPADIKVALSDATNPRTPLIY